MQNPLLEVIHLTKRFVVDEPPVVDDVSFSLAAGEILVLLGPSGCGKTTALRMIAGLEVPDRGAIRLGRRPLVSIGVGSASVPPLPPQQRGIGMVFQDYALFPHMNALKNVMFGIRGPRSRRRQIADEMLARVGLGSLAARRPDQLSGGQQQRVALARSLAPSPPLLLLDEPFSNLDAELRRTMRRDVRSLLRRQETAAILVTHDQEEALTFGDRVAVMNHGRIEQIDSPEAIYRRPASLFVASFLGNTNLLEARSLQESPDEAECILGRVRVDRPVRGTATVSIRPEQITLGPPDSPGTDAAKTIARITEREYCGHDQLFTLKLEQSELIARTDDRCSFTPGDRVSVSVRDPVVVCGDSKPAESRV